MTLIKVERENEERRNRIQEMKKRVEQAVKAKADERQKQRMSENEDFAMNLWVVPKLKTLLIFDNASEP